MQSSIYSHKYSVFLKTLKGLREQLGITQIELAERLNTTQTLVSKCERGERRLDFVEVLHWCDALNVPPQTLLTNLQDGLAVLPPKTNKKQKLKP